jgi:hypothetical protein
MASERNRAGAVNGIYNLLDKDGCHDAVFGSSRPTTTIPSSRYDHRSACRCGTPINSSSYEFHALPPADGHARLGPADPVFYVQFGSVWFRP